MWSLNPVHAHVEVADLMKYLMVENIGIVDQFFQKFRIYIINLYYLNIENKVTLENLIPFIFLFALLPLEKSGRILMSINGIQSNLTLTYQQTCYFFRNLNQDYLLDAGVSHWLKKHQNDDNFQIKEVIRTVENSFYLCDPLFHLQSKIVKHFITPKSYSEILHRKIYYDTIFDKQKVKLPPKESYCSRLARVLFSHKPPPYMTNYRLTDTDYHELSAHIQILIRNMFGYSLRPCKMSVQYSDNSFQSERSNSNYSKYLKSQLSCSRTTTTTTTSGSVVKKNNNNLLKQNSVLPVSILSLDVNAAINM